MSSYQLDVMGLAPAFFTPAGVRQPAQVIIRDGRLWAPPSAAGIKFPPSGAWRNWADTDPDDAAQITAVAQRFGSLTPEGGGSAGESLAVWHELIADMRQLAAGWTADGEVNPAAIGGAAIAAHGMHERISEGMASRPYPNTGQNGLVCTSMLQFWRLGAIKCAYAGLPLRRCRHCNAWFWPIGEGRSDRTFCSTRHRSAFHQQRPPRSQFWAEVI
jgi:hypothetical protein